MWKRALRRPFPFPACLSAERRSRQASSADVMAARAAAETPRSDLRMPREPAWRTDAGAVGAPRASCRLPPAACKPFHGRARRSLRLLPILRPAPARLRRPRRIDPATGSSQALRWRLLAWIGPAMSRARSREKASGEGWRGGGRLRRSHALAGLANAAAPPRRRAVCGGTWSAAHGNGASPRRIGYGFTASPSHQRRSGPRTKIAKCRCGASADALPVAPT